MKTFVQNWPRGKSTASLIVCLALVVVALEMRFGGLLDSGNVEHDGGVLFWILLIVGGAGAVGSGVSLLRPSLVLSADPCGITFGCRSKMASRRTHVPWSDVRQIELGSYSLRITRDRQKRNIVALRIECSDAVDLTGCGDGLLFVVGCAEEIHDRANGRRDTREKHYEDVRKGKNVVLIDASYFTVPLTSVRDHLEALRESASA